MNLKKFTSEEEFIKTSAEFIAQFFTPQASIALSGGTTPEKVYSFLNSNFKEIIKLPKFILTDERHTSLTSDTSNFKMVKNNLFKDLPSDNLIAFDTTLPLQKCPLDYEEKIKKILPLHLCILGIGSDGHTASLFPHSTALFEKCKLVTYTHTENQQIKERLTLTYPMILLAKNLLVLLKGKEKEKILNDLLNSSLTFLDLPAKRLLEHPNLNIYFLEN